MFSYLRYFSAISFIAVLLAAWAAGVYFKNVASDDLEDLVRKNNMTLAQGYVNSLWKKNHDLLQGLYRIKVANWVNYTQFHAFKRETLRYFEEMPVADVSIYTPTGELIVSTDATKEHASQVHAEKREIFDQALQGKVVGQVVEDTTYYLANGEEAVGTLVQTFAPIYSDYYVPVVADSSAVKVEGVIELHYNVTPQWENVKTFQFISSGGIVLIFVILIAMLIVSSRRAESIIAKQHEVNLELTAAAAEAESENRDKSQFLANISHELRTPLNAIIGFSEIIKNDAMPQLDAVYQDYIKDIYGSGVHLLSLINDILDFSKAEAGKLEVSIAEIDMVKMVKNSMRLVIPRAEQAQVTLVEDVPTEHFSLQTDAKKLKQILLNLLSNAVKFTPAGGQVTVSAWYSTTEDRVIIKVMDTGIGIAPKDISQVMQPFGQVDSRLARKYEGTGLGLPLSKKFVEVLGGTFAIESEVGRGTNIIITLPRVFNHDNS